MKNDASKVGGIRDKVFHSRCKELIVCNLLAGAKMHAGWTIVTFFTAVTFFFTTVIYPYLQSAGVFVISSCCSSKRT